jgi:tRNA (guanine-N(7)-)-methyltransferase subunit TRM82
MKMERKVGLEALLENPEEKVAVSGIWRVRDGVVVVCEKVKALLYVPRVDSEGGEKVIPLGDFPLDVVVLGEKVLVSVDSRESGKGRVQVIDLTAGQEDLGLGEKLAKLNGYSGKEVAGTGKELDDLLYNVANLRKRGPLEGGEAMEAEEGATVVEDN